MVTNYADSGQICIKDETSFDGIEIWIPNSRDKNLSPDMIYRENSAAEPVYNSMIKRKGIDVYVRHV